MSFEFGVAQLAKSHDSIVESRQKKTMSRKWVRDKQKIDQLEGEEIKTVDRYLLNALDTVFLSGGWGSALLSGHLATKRLKGG